MRSLRKLWLPLLLLLGGCPPAEVTDSGIEGRDTAPAADVTPVDVTLADLSGEDGFRPDVVATTDATSPDLYPADVSVSDLLGPPDSSAPDVVVDPMAPGVTSVSGGPTLEHGEVVTIAGDRFGANEQVPFVEFTGGTTGWINATPVGTLVKDLFPGGDGSLGFRSNEARFDSGNSTGGIWTYKGMQAGYLTEVIDDTHYRSAGRAFYSQNYVQGVVPGQDQSCNFQWRSRDEGSDTDRPWGTLFFSGWYYNDPSMADGTSSSRIGGKAIRFLPVDIPGDPVSDLPYSFYIGWGWDGRQVPVVTRQNQMAWYQLLYTDSSLWPAGATYQGCAALWYATPARILSDLAPYPADNAAATGSCAASWNFAYTNRNGAVTLPVESQSAAVRKWQRFDFYVESGTLGVHGGRYAMRVLTPSQGWHTYPLELENLYMSLPGIADAELYPYAYGGLSTILWQFHNMQVDGEPTSTGQIWKVWMDDLFIQRGSQARVELGNAPDYHSCTKLEIQRPLGWAENALQVEVNHGGSFAPGETVYLFVIRGDGAVSAGFPLAT